MIQNKNFLLSSMTQNKIGQTSHDHMSEYIANPTAWENNVLYTTILTVELSANMSGK